MNRLPSALRNPVLHVLNHQVQGCGSAVIAMLATGVFLITAIEANPHPLDQVIFHRDIEVHPELSARTLSASNLVAEAKILLHQITTFQNQCT